MYIIKRFSTLHHYIKIYINFIFVYVQHVRFSFISKFHVVKPTATKIQTMAFWFTNQCATNYAPSTFIPSLRYLFYLGKMDACSLQCICFSFYEWPFDGNASKNRYYSKTNQYIFIDTLKVLETKAAEIQPNIFSYFLFFAYKNDFKKYISSSILTNVLK